MRGGGEGDLGDACLRAGGDACEVDEELGAACEIIGGEIYGLDCGSFVGCFFFFFFYIYIIMKKQNRVRPISIESATIKWSGVGIFSDYR